MLLGKELGQERIGRETLILLIDNLNTSLDTEDAKWATLDEELAMKLTMPYVPCVSTHVENINFYLGHRPSLIENQVDRYPNVSVIANQIIPSPEQGDHYEGLLVTVGIEAMCIEGPFTQGSSFDRDGEDLVNRKAQRMAEAIHEVLISNRTLNGVVHEIKGPPRVLFSQVDRRRANTSYGEDYYWQMIRMDYQVEKIASFYG